jgi:hypothetical protein
MLANRRGWDNLPSIQNDEENLRGRQAQEEFEKSRYGFVEGGSFGRGTLSNTHSPNTGRLSGELSGDLGEA